MRTPRPRRLSAGALLCAAFLSLASSAAAEPWSWLRSENDNAREGNEKLRAGDHAGAVESFDRAARELPSSPAVHLNRGLALLGKGDAEQARAAFELAAKPGGDKTVRADAYYDLGLSLYRQGDAKATEEDHEASQALLRDAVEAFHKSLTLRPGDGNTAWNYELAKRRLREEEQKQKEQQDQNQDQQNQDQQDQDQQKQDQDQQKQDQQKQDQQDQDQQKQDQQDQDQQKQDQQKQDQQKQDQQKQDQQKQDQQKQPQRQDQQVLPSQVERALDALQDNEQNLERMRAQQRGGQRPPPEKDW